MCHDPMFLYKQITKMLNSMLYGQSNFFLMLTFCISSPVMVVCLLFNNFLFSSRLTIAHAFLVFTTNIFCVNKLLEWPNNVPYITRFILTHRVLVTQELLGILKMDFVLSNHIYYPRFRQYSC